MKEFVRSLPRHQVSAPPRSRLVVDVWLLALLALVIGYGLVVLYSALAGDQRAFLNQLTRIAVGIVAMLVVAQISPDIFRRWAPWAYFGTLVLLGLVLLFEPIKGSRRWISIPGLFGFQPSEIAKLAVPMMVAWYMHNRPLPPDLKDVGVATVIILVPCALIFVEPDLGTGILIAAAGFSVLLFAGLYWRWILSLLIAAAVCAPALWVVMKDYQKQRVLTMFDPELDPLGTGWNTIQAKTAIGSGGLTGKGLFNGTQSHLDFLPEGSTDFIIAVLAEEWGLVGVLALLVLYVLIVGRGFYIASVARDAFGRLLAGSLTLTFFVYAFVNIAMVSGIAPVVGVPLPMVSYGGTAVMTLLVGFGLLMSIRAHRR